MQTQQADKLGEDEIDKAVKKIVQLNLNIVSVNSMTEQSKHYKQLMDYCHLLDLKDDACAFLKHLNGPGDDSLEQRRRK